MSLKILSLKTVLMILFLHFVDMQNHLFDISLDTVSKSKDIYNVYRAPLGTKHSGPYSDSLLSPASIGDV